jgi:hypothetical protein
MVEIFSYKEKFQPFFLIKSIEAGYLMLVIFHVLINPLNIFASLKN